MKKILITIIVLGILAVAYWLISPLWRVVYLNESIPISMPEEKMPTNSKSVDMTVSPRIEGAFVSDEHEVVGKAILVDIGGGKKILSLRDFETLNGPDLRIYLATDTTASEFIDLGDLKATKGNINYEIPDGADSKKYDTVLIWCRAFAVLFGHAELK